MKRLILFVAFASLFTSAFGQTFKLPASRHLAGALNSADSSFGDEFYNFPPIFNGRAAPGRTRLSGWIEFDFKEPNGSTVDFTFRYDGAGADDGILFPGGQTYELLLNRAFNTDGLVNKGTLNLNTGEVANIEVHATFQNSVISKVTSNIRIPFGFLNDYPPNEFPIPLPFSDKPTISQTGRFTADVSGNIKGFEFRGVTIAPVTLFPQLALFPIYSFGENGNFYFASPTGCIAGTPPANCINWTTNPDGVLLASNAFFHPHFELITSELKEVSVVRQGFPAEPVGVASSAGLVAGGSRLYHISGFDGSAVTDRVQIFDPATNLWSAAKPLPQPAMAGQSAAVGSRIYVAGGYDVGQGKSIDTLQVLDTVSNTWSTLAPLPAPVSGGVAAAVDTRIYVLGGWTNSSAGAPVLTDQMQIFDSASGAWSTGPALPFPVAGASVVVIGTDLYLIGGRIVDNTITKKVSIFDSAAKKWRGGLDTLRGVYEASAAYASGRIYLAGGRQTVDGPADSARMQVFETAQNIWRDGQAAPVAIASGAAAALDGKFYIAGGRIMTPSDSAPGYVTDTILQYDPNRGWAVSSSRPVFTADDVVSAACGKGGSADLSPGSRAIILGYNFATGTVTAPSVRSANGVFTSDLPTRLNGIQIRIDGKPAPLVSVGPGQVEFQIPYDVTTDGTNRRFVALDLIKDGQETRPVSVRIPILPIAPAIYVHRYGELRNVGYLDGATAIARNADGRLNHPANPARARETISLTLTGLGQVTPTLANGQRSPETGSQVIAPVAVKIGDQVAVVKSVALVAREIGLYEVKVEVPANSPLRNNVPVQVTGGGVPSNLAQISVR
jgi:uncharacterized protein (TIGR03437 family)